MQMKVKPLEVFGQIVLDQQSQLASLERRWWRLARMDTLLKQETKCTMKKE
jgi:hypothetical protein